MRILPVVFALAVAMTGWAVPAQAAPAVGTYVALGDSFAAIADLTDLYGTPGCFRSRSNYPAMVAAALAPARFVDVSCGSAETRHMTRPQATGIGVNSPQLDALTPGTDLVTLNIGGNDIDLPATLGRCGIGALTEPDGNPCQRHYVRDGVDRLVQRIDTEVRPAVAAVLREIRVRSPHATIVVVGYPAPLPPSGGCFPAVPVATGDVGYLYAGIRRLTQAMMDEAAAVGGIGVNAFEVLGHDMCRPPGVRWIEPLVPAAPTTPFHPNTLGARGVADLVVAALHR
ncbi:SGNH/GDSL hydrolase family protein [Nocardia brasiliensis]